MPILKLKLCALMMLLVLSSCTSTPPVTQAVATPCPVNPPALAALMQPAPDLLTPLNGIITPSSSVSPSPQLK